MCISTLYVAYSVYTKIFLQKSPQGFTALIAAITFLSGIVLFFLGIIGEYVGRIYEETKGRPQYIVARMAGRFKNDWCREADGSFKDQQIEEKVMR